MKVGDLVKLKSGGPEMAVLNIHRTVRVGWVDESGAINEAQFPRECLVVIGAAS